MKEEKTEIAINWIKLKTVFDDKKKGHGVIAKQIRDF